MGEGMPNSQRELFKYIWDKADNDEISRGVAIYAIGWLFYDLFERADHEEQLTNALVTPADIDRFARDLPTNKIDRDIGDAQQAFGTAAAEFMEEDTKRRIASAIDASVVSTVRGYTNSLRAFGLNVLAGVISGLLFAAVSLGLYFYVRVDPSINNVGKAALERAGASADVH